MENITCWAFRKLCVGTTDSYTGMLNLTNLVKRSNSWNEIDTFPIEDQRQWIQFVTSKEADCSKFLKKLEEETKKYPEKDNIYGLQLNCACPSPNIVGIGQGAALIKRPAKIVNILNELLKQDKYKVGIKLRLGLNKKEVKQGKIFTLFKELEKLAKENPNFTNVTIHLKHAKELSSSNYDYSILNKLSSYNLPLIINGGITSSEDIKRILKSIPLQNQKNIQGVMIGREALRNPNCFLEINQNLKSSSLKKRDFKEINKEFYKLCKQHPPKPIYLTNIKKKCDWA